MRHPTVITTLILLLNGMIATAQERIPAPPPDASYTPGLSLGPTAGQPAISPAPPSGPPTPLSAPSPVAPQSTPPGSAASSQYPQPNPYPPANSGLGQAYPNYPPPGGYPPGPYGPYPNYPYGPPPGMYGPPPPPPIIGDPVANPRFWFGVDTLIWWSKGQSLPPYTVTTGPASQGGNAGGLGVPGTTSLTAPLSYGSQGGLRLYSGWWFDYDHKWGLDGSIFFLGEQSAGFGVGDRSQTGSTVINEPISGAPFITQVSTPGVQTGGVSVDTSTRLWGADLNLLYNLYRGNNWTLNLLGGFRYLQVNESLDIVANSAFFTTTNYYDNAGNLLVSAPPGSTVTVVDQFNTRNQFYGGQIGARYQYIANRWSFSGAGTLAIGGTHEMVSVNGNTAVYPANGNPVYLTGGNYATINSGVYSVNRFAVAPAFQINVGYQFTPYLRGLVGYNFLYLSSVARPGNQIDNSYDGVVHPTVPMASSTFWSQGISLVLQFSF